MSLSGRARIAFAVGIAVLALAGGTTTFTQGEVVDPTIKGNLPNPNPTVTKNWGELPGGRTWGSTAGVDIGPDGQVWAYDRCGSNTCAASTVDPIVKFDRASGKLLTSFGGGMIVFPTASTWIVTATSGSPTDRPTRRERRAIRSSSSVLRARC